MRFIRKTNYAQDVNLIQHSGQVLWYGLLLAAVMAGPLWLDRFLLGEFSLVFIFAIAGVGLMILVGYTGLVSLGHAAFLAIGAYVNAYLLNRGVPLPVSFAAATIFSGVVGGLVGIPALRMTGIYLAVATLAFAVIVEQVLVHWVSVTGGFSGMPVAKASLFGANLSAPVPFYFMCLVLLILATWLVMNLLRSAAGRAMTAVRDSAGRSHDEILDDARGRIQTEMAVSVGELLLLPQGTMSKTSSGKRRHQFYRGLFLDGGLEALLQ